METIFKTPENKFKKLTKTRLKEVVNSSKSLAECLSKLEISSTQSTRLKLTILLQQKQIDCSHFVNDIILLEIANQKLKDYQSKENTKRLQRLKRARLDVLNPVKVAKWIVQDSRKKDKLCGLTNDLTREVVTPLVSRPCDYCGETKLRMTLDRIDNSKGHIISNVRPCCIRCNLIRRDMPYQAWLSIVPSVRDAREKGLFEDWSPGNTRKIKP